MKGKQIVNAQEFERELNACFKGKVFRRALAGGVGFSCSGNKTIGEGQTPIWLFFGDSAGYLFAWDVGLMRFEAMSEDAAHAQISQDISAKFQELELTCLGKTAVAFKVSATDCAPYIPGDCDARSFLSGEEKGLLPEKIFISFDDGSEIAIGGNLDCAEIEVIHR